MGFPLCMCQWRVSPLFHANSTSRYFLSAPLTAERRGLVGLKRTGSPVLPVWASRGKYGQIWPFLSIMSRWKGLDRITNLELITKVVAGLCFIPSPTLLSPLSGDSCRHLSVFLRGALPSLLSTTLDALLILFHLITPCLWVSAH